MMRFVAYWAAAGLVVPIVILIVSLLEQWIGKILIWRLDLIALAVWPSSFFLMATHGQEFTAFGFLVMAISIAINVLLYSAVGAAIWFLWRSVRHLL